MKLFFFLALAYPAFASSPAATSCPEEVVRADHQRMAGELLYRALRTSTHKPKPFGESYYGDKRDDAGGIYVVYRKAAGRLSPIMVMDGAWLLSLPLDHLSPGRRSRLTVWQRDFKQKLVERMGDSPRLFFGNDALRWEYAEFKWQGVATRLTLPVFPSVFPPITFYTQNMIEAALETSRGHHRVLVMGCGSGIDAVAVAKFRGAQVDCVDINPLAVANSEAAAYVTGQGARVRSWQSNLFDSVVGRYDRIYFDSPLALPAAWARVDANLADREGALLDRFMKELPEHLTPGGSAYLMSWPNISGSLTPALKSRKLRTFQDEGGSAFAVHEITLR